MELTRLKGRLRTAQRGHKLLKDKRDELMKQFMEVVREDLALRQKVEQSLTKAYGSFTVASALMSPEMLEQALLCPKQSVSLETGTENVMSVEVPRYEFKLASEDGGNIYPYGFAQTSGELDDAVRELGADAGFNGRNDLLIGGRKFSGNAQYRLPGCIVHHGSLLYDTDLAQMAAATTVDPYKIQSKSIKSVRDRVTNISEHLPGKLPAEQFKACMLRHLMRGSTQTYCLTPADDARIRALAEEKFAAWDAVYGRNPRFNIERTGHFAGGKFTFRLDVQRGVICQASVWGDFFSTLSAEAITGALTGCRYDRASVLAALRAGGIDGAVYRISAEDMAGLLAD